MNLEDLVKFKVKSVANPEKTQNQQKQYNLPTSMTKPETTLSQVDLPSLQEIRTDQIKYLKQYFGNQYDQYREFKVKHLNPVMNKYSQSQQPQQQRPESEPQSIEEYKQRLLKIKAEHESAPQYDPQSVLLDFPPLLNLQQDSMQRRDSLIGQKPSHTRVSTGDQIDYNNQWEPYQKPFVISQNQTSTLSKVALTRQKDFITYPDNQKKTNNLSKKQRVAEREVLVQKETRERYLNEKHNLYSHSAYPEKSQSQSIDYRPKTEFSQTKVSTLPQAYYTHISDKFQPSLKRQQGYSNNELSPIKVSKVDLIQKIIDAKSTVSKKSKRIPKLRSQSVVPTTPFTQTLRKQSTQVVKPAETTIPIKESSDTDEVPNKTVISLGLNQLEENLFIAAATAELELTLRTEIDETDPFQTISQPDHKFHKSQQQFTQLNQMQQHFTKIGTQSIPTFQTAPFESSRYKRYPRFNICTGNKESVIGQTVISLNNGFVQVAKSSQILTDQQDPPEQSTDEIQITSMVSLEQCVTPSKDPFDAVTLDKHIDNALLTSNRTVYGLNNTISSSLKIVHNKFTPMLQSDVKTAGAQTKKQYLKHQLYEVQEEMPSQYEISTDVKLKGKAYQYRKFSNDKKFDEQVQIDLFNDQSISTQKQESSISDKQKQKKTKTGNNIKREKKSFAGMGVQGTVILSNNNRSLTNSPQREKNKVIEVRVRPEVHNLQKSPTILLSEREPQIIQNCKDPLSIIQQMKALITNKNYEESQFVSNKMTTNIVFSQTAAGLDIVAEPILSRESYISGQITDTEQSQLQEKPSVNFASFKIPKRKLINTTALVHGNTSSEVLSPFAINDDICHQSTLGRNNNEIQETFQDQEASLDKLIRRVTVIPLLKEQQKEPTIVQVPPPDSENEKIILRSLEQDLGSNGRQLKAMIDKLYAKEKQLIYSKLNVRDECVSAGDIIFNLGKCHNLKLKKQDTPVPQSAEFEGVSCAVRGTKFEIKDQ